MYELTGWNLRAIFGSKQGCGNGRLPTLWLVLNTEYFSERSSWILYSLESIGVCPIKFAICRTLQNLLDIALQEALLVIV